LLDLSLCALFLLEVDPDSPVKPHLQVFVNPVMEMFASLLFQFASNASDLSYCSCRAIDVEVHFHFDGLVSSLVIVEG
jgi:hypothetical protein